MENEILEDIDILDLNSLCRLCSNASEDPLIGIYDDYSDDNFAKKIMTYLPIKVSQDDILPVKICVICNDILLKWNEFYQTCLHADEKFHKIAVDEKFANNSYAKHLEDEDHVEDKSMIDWEQSNVVIDIDSEEELDDMAVSSIANEDQIDGYNFEEDSRSAGEEENEADQPTTRLCSCNQEKDLCSTCTEKYKKTLGKNYTILYQNDESTPAPKLRIQCGICGEYFERKIGLRIHLKKHKEIVCNVCKKVFKSYHNLVNHKKLHQDQIVTYDCPICGSVMNRKYNLMVHINSHMADYPCKICCLSFNSLVLLDNHKITHQKEREEYEAIQNHVKCPECSEMFISRYELYTHTLVDHNIHDSKYVCYCGRIFEADIMLKKHIKTEHNTFECDVCNKKFRKRKGLQEHKNTHLNHRPYKCDACGKTFRYSSNLSQHKSIHKGIRKFECFKCGKAFLRSNTLAMHLKSHQNVRKYVCELCEASFVQSSALVKHKRTIHRQCDRCGAIVGDKKQMHVHMWNDCGGASGDAQQKHALV